MHQWLYVLIMFAPCFMVHILVTCVLGLSWYKWKGYYARRFCEIIAVNVFPEILKEKTTKNGKVVLYFDKEKMQLKGEAPKVKWGLFLVCYLLVLNILQLFGTFLFLKTSSDCDEAKDCFLFGGQTNHPVNCKDFKTRNETTALVCYEIVFQPAKAIGLCYGIFKTFTVVLTVATTLMMNMNFSPEKIVCDLHSCLIMTELSLAKHTIASSCLVCAFCTIIYYRGPLHGVDWEEVNTLFTVTIICVLTSVYIYVMPWEELMHLKKFHRTKEFLTSGRPVIRN